MDKAKILHLASLKDARTSAIAHLAFEGLRTKEIATIQQKNVNFREFKIAVSCKGCLTGEYQIVQISKQTRHALDVYFKQNVTSEQVFIFASKKKPKSHITPRMVQYVLKNLLIASGCEVAQPHDFRRFFAQELYKRTQSIEHVRKRMRHANIYVTSIYLSKKLEIC